MSANRILARLSTLLGAWGAYWLLLLGVKLGPAIAAIVRATSGPKTGSSVNLSYGDRGFLLEVTDQGQAVYTANTHLLALALWVAGPPLILWIVWAVLRRRDERVATT